MVVKLRRLSASISAQWTLVAVGATMLGTYPFILKVFSPATYYVVLSLAILTLALSILRPQVTVDALAGRHQPRWLVVFAGLYVLYLATLLLYTLIGGTSVAASLRAALSLVMRLLLALALWLFVPYRLLNRSIGWFTWLVTVLAFVGVLMVALVGLGVLPVIGEVRIDTFGLRDTGLRQFYGLGFGWNRLHIAPGVAFPRLQSFTSEAGNFAFLLLLAGIWHLRRGRWLLTSALLIPLLLTWSLGAVVTAASLALLSTLSLHVLPRRHGLDRRKVVLRLGALMLVLGLMVGASTRLAGSFDRIRSFTVEDYLASKFGSGRETTSLGVRAESAATIVDVVVTNTGQGRGIGGLEGLDVSLALGWLRALLEAGIIGWMFYLGAMGTLLTRAAYRFVRADRRSAYHAAMVLVLAAAAFQRAPMDATTWHWWLIVGFIKVDRWTTISSASSARARSALVSSRRATGARNVGELGVS